MNPFEKDFELKSSLEVNVKRILPDISKKYKFDIREWVCYEITKP